MRLKKCFKYILYILYDWSYIPKKAFEECDVNEWSKGGEVQEGGDIHTAGSEKTKQSHTVYRAYGDYQLL